MKRHNLTAAAVVVLGLLMAARSLGAEPTAPPDDTQTNEPARIRSMGLPELAAELAALQGRAEAAWAELQRAQANVPSLVRLRTKFEASPEYRTAAAKLMQAQQAIDRARREVMAKVRNNPEYCQAVERRDAIEAELDRLRSGASEATVYYLASSKLEYAKQASRIEVEAMASEARVPELLRQVVAAGRALQGLKDRFRATYMDDPSVVTAVAAVQKAGAEYDLLMESLAVAQAQYGQAIEDRNVGAASQWYLSSRGWWVRPGWWWPNAFVGGYMPVGTVVESSVTGWR